MIVNTEELRVSMAGGATLPAEWYYDPAVLRLEQDRRAQPLGARSVASSTWGTVT